MWAEIIGDDVWLNGYRVATLRADAPASVIEHFKSFLSDDDACQPWGWLDGDGDFRLKGVDWKAVADGEQL